MATQETKKHTTAACNCSKVSRFYLKLFLLWVFETIVFSHTNPYISKVTQQYQSSYFGLGLPLVFSRRDVVIIQDYWPCLQPRCKNAGIGFQSCSVEVYPSTEENKWGSMFVSKPNKLGQQDFLFFCY